MIMMFTLSTAIFAEETAFVSDDTVSMFTTNYFSGSIAPNGFKPLI